MQPDFLLNDWYDYGRQVNRLHVDVAAGQIVVTNQAGSQVFNPGQFGYVPSAGAPPTVVPSANGIRVTMPAVIANNNSNGRTLGNASAGQDQCTP